MRSNISIFVVIFCLSFQLYSLDEAAAKPVSSIILNEFLASEYEEYQVLSSDAHGGTNLQNNIESLVEHHARLKDSLNTGEYTHESFSEFDWFLVLLESAALFQIPSEVVVADSLELKVTQPVKSNSHTFEYKLYRPSSFSGRLLLEKQQDAVADLLNRMPVYVLPFIFESFAVVDEGRIASNALLQLSLKTFFESLINREAEVLSFLETVDDRTVASKLSNHIVESIRKLYAVMPSVESLQIQWPDTPSNHMLGGNIYLTSDKALIFANKALLKLDTSSSVAIRKLFSEYAVITLNGSIDSNALEDWKSEYHSHIGNKSETEYSSTVINQLVQSEIIDAFISNNWDGLEDIRANHILVEAVDEYLRSIFNVNTGVGLVSFGGKEVASFDGILNADPADITFPLVRSRFEENDASVESGYEKLSPTIASLVKYFFSSDSRKTVLDGNREIKTVLLRLYFIDEFGDEDNVKENSKNTIFVSALDASERQEFFNIAKSTSYFWQSHNWTEGGLISRILDSFYENEFRYHGEMVFILQNLSELIAFKDLNSTPQHEPVTTLSQFFSKSASSDSDEVVEPELKVILESIYSTGASDTVILASKREIENLEKKYPSFKSNEESAADNDNLFFTLGTQLNENVFSDQIFGADQIFTDSEQEYYRLDIASEYEGISEKYRNFIDRDFGLFFDSEVSDTSTWSDSRLNQLFRYNTEISEFDNEYTKLDNQLNVRWNRDYGGKAIYESSVSSLIALATVANLEKRAEFKHRQIGFVYEPELTSGAWLDDVPKLDKRLEVRGYYVSSQAIMRALLAKQESGLYGRLNKLLLQEPSVDYFSTQRLSNVPLEASSIMRGAKSVSPFRHAIKASYNSNRAQLKKLDQGRDAFGYTGIMQMASGIGELLDKIRFYATLLEQENVERLSKVVETELTVDREEYAVERHRNSVYAKSFELAEIDKRIELSALEIEIAKLNVDKSDAEALASHFDIEASRQLAESAHALATEALLDQNLQDYAAFQIEAQVQLLLFNLPRYQFHLHVAGERLGSSAEVIDELKRLLASKRQAYLSEDNRDLENIVKQVAVKIIDTVASSYGLPKLGTILVTTYDGIQAANDGQYGKAIAHLTDAAKLAGADKYIADKVDVILDTEGMEWVRGVYDDLEKNDTINSIIEIAQESGLDKLAEAKSLAIVRNVGKGVLSDQELNAIIPPSALENLSSKDIVEVVSTSATKRVETLLRQNFKSGLKGALQKVALGSNDFEDIVLSEEPKSALDLSKLTGDIQTEVSANLKKYLDQKIEIQEDKEKIFKKQIELFLGSDEMKSAAGGVSILEDEKFEKTLAALENGLQNSSGWVEFRKSFVEYSKSRNYPDGMLGVFEEVVADVEENGLGRIQTSKIFMSSLGEALIRGQFDPEFIKATTTTDKEAAKAIAQDLQAYTTNVRNTLVGVKTVVDLTVSTQTAKFVPETKGVLINTLESWNDDLDELVGDIGNTELSNDVISYYQNVFNRFDQVDLFKEIESASELEEFMNPPEVTLTPEMLKIIDGIDDKLVVVENLVSGITQSQKSIHDQIEKIYKAEEEEYSRMSAQLFKPFDDEISKSVSALKGSDGAIRLVGWPSDSINEKLKSNPNVNRYVEAYNTLAKTEGNLKVLEGELKPLEIFRPSSTDSGKVQNQLGIGMYGHYSGRYTNKLEEVNSAKEKISEIRSNLSNLKKMAIESFVDDLIEASQSTSISLGEAEKAILLSTFDSSLFPLPPGASVRKECGNADDAEANACRKERYDLARVEQDSNGKIARSILGLDGQPKGLYKQAKSDLSGTWKANIESKMSRYRNKAQSHKAVAMALRSSEANALSEAYKISQAISKINVDLAIGAKEILEIQRKIVEKELRSVEYQFFGANTELSLAQLKKWQLDASGEGQSYYSPVQIKLINKKIMQSLRDIGFIAKYYEGRDVGNTLIEFLSNSENFYLSDTWKPNSLEALIDKIDFVREPNSDRNEQKSVLITKAGIVDAVGGLQWNGISLSREEILRWGKKVQVCGGGPNYMSVYLELQLQDGTAESIKNPRPFWSQTDVNQLGDQGKKQPNTFEISINESAVQSRTRYFSSYVVIDPDDRELKRNILIRHMGDGYITVPSHRSDVNKDVVSILWKPQRRNVETYQDLAITKNGERLELREHGSNSSCGGTATDVVSLDYFALLEEPGFGLTSSLSNTKLEILEEIKSSQTKDWRSRSAFYMYPIAGTYQLLFQLDGSDELPSEYKADILFVGTTTGGGS